MKTMLEELGRHQKTPMQREAPEPSGGADQHHPLVPPSLLLWAPPIIFRDLLPPPPRMHLGPTLSRFDPMTLVHPTGLYI
jgi:hypothetical protein